MFCPIIVVSSTKQFLMKILLTWAWSRLFSCLWIWSNQSKNRRI